MNTIEETKIVTAGVTTLGGTPVTWLDHANAYMDLAAASVAVVAGVLGIIWTLQRIRKEKKQDKLENRRI